jgi:hypothetical protein
MPKKRTLVFDAHNVIKLLREFGASFEDIAALGCHFENEPNLKVTPELIAVWFEEEKEAGRYLRL